MENVEDLDTILKKSKPVLIEELTINKGNVTELPKEIDDEVSTTWITVKAAAEIRRKMQYPIFSLKLHLHRKLPI